MKYLIAFTIIATALAAPLSDDGNVEVYTDNAGHYKYAFTSKNITITEERQHDGSVVGSFSFIDDSGLRQTVTYTSGVNGFIPQGSSLPVATDLPVADLPEVTEARNQHLAISAAVEKVLPKLNLDGLVDEAPIVPLTNAELLHAVNKAANPELLAFAQETAEVAEAKQLFLEEYKKALVH